QTIPSALCHDGQVSAHRHQRPTGIFPCFMNAVRDNVPKIKKRIIERASLNRLEDFNYRDSDGGGACCSHHFGDIRAESADLFTLYACQDITILFLASEIVRTESLLEQELNA